MQWRYRWLILRLKICWMDLNYTNPYAKWIFITPILQVWIWSMRQQKGWVFKTQFTFPLPLITIQLTSITTIILAITIRHLTVNMVSWVRPYIIFHLINKITLYSFTKRLITQITPIRLLQSMTISKRSLKVVLIGCLRASKRRWMRKKIGFKKKCKRKVVFYNLN